MNTEITTVARQTLHGYWQRTIAGRGIDYVPVPGSYRPVGECVLEFAFDWTEGAAAERVFLVTEGVMANAEFTLNGQVLWTAGPWTPYRFEIPSGLLRARNVVTARLQDITASFGTTPGSRSPSRWHGRASGRRKCRTCTRSPCAWRESSRTKCPRWWASAAWRCAGRIST